MQTYNSFNDLVAAQSASPLVSDMSVFNEIKNPDLKRDCDAIVAEWLSFKSVFEKYQAIQKKCKEAGVEKYEDSVQICDCNAAFSATKEKIQEILGDHRTGVFVKAAREEERIQSGEFKWRDHKNIPEISTVAKIRDACFCRHISDIAPKHFRGIR